MRRCVFRYDASAVLEFLWALARNPRLWQGREKLTPKHQEPVDVLGLNEEQVCFLCFFFSILNPILQF